MLISIIVPVYNVQDYLEECIESIAQQSYQEIEIILIDDGSKDNCPQICDALVRKDSRIQVIHKNNGGLSSARNAGMKRAKGEYLIFFDSDDVMRAGALEEIAEAAASKPDVLITALFSVTDMTHLFFPDTLFTVPGDKSKDTAIRHVFLEKKDVWPSVQYIVNRAYLDRIALIFDEGYYHEDVSWTARLLAAADTFGYYNKVWYIRRLGRTGSIMSSLKVKKTLDMLTLTRMCQNSEQLKEINPSQAIMIRDQLSRTAIWSLKYYPLYNREEKKTICDLLQQDYSMLMHSKLLKHKLFCLFLRIFGVNHTLSLIRFMIRV